MDLKFLIEFLRHPFATGAVAPSSRALARAMVAGMDPARARVVVEYGPGTGAFTGAVLAHFGSAIRFVAIEKNPVLSAAFRRRFPQVRLAEDSVANVGAILAGMGEESCDYIVCGLPWASFGSALQEELLAATVAVLRPGGMLATFAYAHGPLLLPSARAFRRRLERSFATVARSRTIWWNLPPAFVYRCVR
jgi:phospholipid N-methyltransferase